MPLECKKIGQMNASTGSSRIGQADVRVSEPALLELGLAIYSFEISWSRRSQRRLHHDCRSTDNKADVILEWATPAGVAAAVF